MTDAWHRFTVGEFACTVVSDGVIRVPPPPEKRAAGDPGELMDVACLLIEWGDRTYLVDTGCGSRFQDTSGKLLENLEAIGVDPTSIDAVIYTHGHTDHVGGTYVGGRAVFPNARQVVLRRELESWSSLPPENEHYEMFEAARETLLPVPEVFDVAEENAEVFPGISLLAAYGHSPGNAMVGLLSNGEGLLCVGDLIHSQVELEDPGYYAFLDVIPEPAAQLRTEGLAEVAASGVRVFACHFPFPGLGRFANAEGKLRWRPE